MNEKAQDFKREVADICSRNIRRVLSQRKNISKKELGAVCHVDPSQVTMWTLEEGAVLPQAHYLKAMAAALDVTVDWLLADHRTVSEYSHTRTYAQALQAVMNMVEVEILEISDIKDVILRDLAASAAFAMSSDVSETQKDAWYGKIVKKFDMPFLLAFDEEMRMRLLDKHPELSGIDIIETDRNVAMFVTRNLTEARHIRDDVRKGKPYKYEFER